MPSTQLSFKSIPKDQASFELVRSKAWQEMVEVCGRNFQLLGLPGSTGRIYGLLYLSAEPLSLNQMSSMLGISKGSVSVGTRQLISWSAIRKVWVPGDRRDFYEVVEDLGQLVSGIYYNLIKTKIDSSKKRLANIVLNLQEDIKCGVITSDKKRILEGRIKALKKIQERILKFLPLIEKIIC